MFRADKLNPKVNPLLGEVASQFQRAMNWMVTGFGLPTDKVPFRMKQGGVQPVTEVYRPRLRYIFAPDTTTGGVQDFVVPVGVYWEFVSCGFRLTATATVGSREVIAAGLQVSAASASVVFSTGCGKAQTAGQTFFYSVGAYGMVGDTQVAAGREVIPTPVGLIIPERFTFRIQDINGIDATDAYSLFILVVKEHPGVQLA